MNVAFDEQEHAGSYSMCTLNPSTAENFNIDLHNFPLSTVLQSEHEAQFNATLAVFGIRSV